VPANPAIARLRRNLLWRKTENCSAPSLALMGTQAVISAAQAANAAEH
tara:strand:+ start:313 stop:456 length:144 start_codon:yes stop_codon:yes gene_type:complete